MCRFDAEPCSCSGICYFTEFSLTWFSLLRLDVLGAKFQNWREAGRNLRQELSTLIIRQRQLSVWNSCPPKCTLHIKKRKVFTEGVEVDRGGRCRGPRSAPTGSRAQSGVRDQPGMGRCACCELLRFHFAALEKKRAWVRKSLRFLLRHTF